MAQLGAPVSRPARCGALRARRSGDRRSILTWNSPVALPFPFAPFAAFARHNRNPAIRKSLLATALALENETPIRPLFETQIGVRVGWVGRVKRYGFPDWMNSSIFLCSTAVRLARTRMCSMATSHWASL